MASKIKDYPVDKDGNMSYYYDHDFIDGKHVPMRREPIVPFVETMEFQSYVQGRSSLRLILKDSKGRIWSMFANSLNLFVQNSQKGVLKGEWVVGKRGANYGLLLIEVL